MIAPKKEMGLAYYCVKFMEKNGQKTNPFCLKLKKQIRNFNNKPEPTSWVVKDYGIDGYIILQLLPEFLNQYSIEEVKEYFEEQEAIQCPNSLYDCTGRFFTSWYKIFRRRNRWYAYHSVGVDV